MELVGSEKAAPALLLKPDCDLVPLPGPGHVPFGPLAFHPFAHIQPGMFAPQATANTNGPVTLVSTASDR